MSRNLNFRDETFRPYATALGELSLAWNDLHETLAGLFWTVLGINNGMVPFAVWYSIKVDRSQRDMLRAATDVIALGHNVSDRARKEIGWLLDRADSLEELRNNALHSPFLKSGEEVIPAAGLGHRRAKQLTGKNLLKEFRWFYDTAIVLREYAAKIDAVMRQPRAAWPERPSLPNRGDTNESKQRLPA